MKSFISLHQNFLDKDLIPKIRDYAIKNLNTYKWRTSHCWGETIKRFSSPVSILEIPDEFTALIQKKFKAKITRPMFYLSAAGSYIGWHNDADYEFTATLYLNEKWNINHGGIFLYSDTKKNTIHGVPPLLNQCIINHGAVPHSISLTTPEAPWRYTLQIFGPRVTETISKKRQQVFDNWIKQFPTK